MKVLKKYYTFSVVFLFLFTPTPARLLTVCVAYDKEEYSIDDEWNTEAYKEITS
jgi:hypothetical protein